MSILTTRLALFFYPDEDIDRYPFALQMREPFCIKPHSAYCSFCFSVPMVKAESATREQAALLHPAFCSRVVHTLPKICAQNPGAGLNLWIYYKGLLHFSINHLLNIIFYRIRIIESEMEIFFVRGTINYFH